VGWKPCACGGRCIEQYTLIATAKGLFTIYPCVCVQESYDVPAKKPFTTTEWFPACFTDVCINCLTATDLGTWQTDPAVVDGWTASLIVFEAVRICGRVLDILSLLAVYSDWHPWQHAVAACHICFWLCCEYTGNFDGVQFSGRCRQRDGLTVNEVKFI